MHNGWFICLYLSRKAFTLHLMWYEGEDNTNACLNMWCQTRWNKQYYDHLNTVEYRYIKLGLLEISVKTKLFLSQELWNDDSEMIQ
jgi:hypothetical protein